jgi:hypothetical protein
VDPSSSKETVQAPLKIKQKNYKISWFIMLSEQSKLSSVKLFLNIFQPKILLVAETLVEFGSKSRPYLSLYLIHILLSSFAFFLHFEH